MLQVKDVSKTFNQGTANETAALRNLSLHVKQGDYVTLIGGNGSGKSTLLNCIAGVFNVDQGHIIVDSQDLTGCSEHKRAKVFGRVFQDAMVGTSAQMTIEENLALALRRGMRRTLSRGIAPKEKTLFQERLKILELGLEHRLDTQVGLLSGGQRQALTLLMSILREPKVLLLDEHTAALDPKTAVRVLELTDRIVQDRQLTTLMVTHNMRDAIRYGNRLVMMYDGTIILDVKGEAKRRLSVEYLLNLFDQASGEEFPDQKALLA
ncbi:MAG: ATP-binding cassette domain-containing protein [Firmicutes bacterium]|nr:ATP-binding cassette domain-containing protein [Bacillota bacterium]